MLIYGWNIQLKLHHCNLVGMSYHFRKLYYFLINNARKLHMSLQAMTWNS